MQNRIIKLIKKCAVGCLLLQILIQVFVIIMDVIINASIDIFNAFICIVPPIMCMIVYLSLGKQNIFSRGTVAYVVTIAIRIIYEIESYIDIFKGSMTEYYFSSTAKAIEKIGSDIFNLIYSFSFYFLLLVLIPKLLNYLLKDENNNSESAVSETGTQEKTEADISLSTESNSDSLNNGIIPELSQYKELLDSGVITQEEFDAKKKQVLGL